MYQAKYAGYITKSVCRFAEGEEIKAVSAPAGRRAAGVPLLTENGTLYVDREDNHTIVIGPTGCKKSRVVALPTLASIIESGESAIINDPKGELYRRTAARAEEQGAEVRLLNFRDPLHSDGWNPFRILLDLYEDEEDYRIFQHCEEIAAAILGTVENRDDEYWAISSRNYLVAVLNMMLESAQDERFLHLKNLFPFCYPDSERVVKWCADMAASHSAIAMGLKGVVELEAERTKSCIYSTLTTALGGLAQNEGLMHILGESSFSIADCGKKQMLIYLIYPDEKQGLNALINLFVTQAYQILVDLCADQQKDRLPVRVNFILDEFSNLAPIQNFDNRISESRSKNIRYFLFVQSFNQLKEKYGHIAETILSNCSNWICFSSKETPFLEKLAAICGTQLDYNGCVRPLISAAELQYLQKEWTYSEVLVIKQGLHPYVAALPDFDTLRVAKRYRRPAVVPAYEERKMVLCQPRDWILNLATGEFSWPLSFRARESVHFRGLPGEKEE